MARGACGPGARNSPRRPAPSPLPAGRRPGPARPAPTPGANRLWNRGIARESAPRAREGKPPGFPGEGLGAWRRGGRCQRGLGAGPKQKKKKKLGHAPRGILGANSLIGGVCCFCRCRRCHLRTAPVCRANAARPAGVVRGHGLTPAGGRTRAHARSGREGSLWARHAASWSPARVSPAGATLGRRWWLGGEAPPSLKTVKGVFTLKTRAVRE